MVPIVKQQSLTSVLKEFVPQGTLLQECLLEDISMNSRRVRPGCLFLSLARQSQQRALYLQQALDKGAFAVLYDLNCPLTEDEQKMLEQAVVEAYPVAELGLQAGAIAARFYDCPSESLTVIAVTGTNGKTSVTQFIAQALEELGQPCGVIGTLGTGRIRELEMTGMTTPDPVSIQWFLARFKAQSCSYVVLEASSHALEQGRLTHVAIDVAVLTNLSRDHLDYHQSMQAYAAAKYKLFDFDSLKTAVLNLDDQFGEQLSQALKDNLEVFSYAKSRQAGIRAENIICHRGGIEFDVRWLDQCFGVSAAMLGRFNVDNLLATIAVLFSLGYQQDDVSRAVACCHAVNGRMQSYDGPHQPMVVIDYAHTPDALQQALQSLREHLSRDGRLWCVFGCGGDRDKGKRSLMGHITETLADNLVVTDDNPRTEDHIAIIRDILSGCCQPEKVHIEHDRKQAIIYAINHASEKDIVIVAGKGHEDYQEINRAKYPFSDASVVSDYLDSLSCGVSNNMAGGR